MPTEQELNDAYWSGVDRYEKGDALDQVSEWAERLWGPATDPIGKAHQKGYDDAVVGKVK